MKLCICGHHIDHHNILGEGECYYNECYSGAIGCLCPKFKEKPMIIAGVGSRKISGQIRMEMIEIGRWARQEKVWVRSGRAEGSDQAFASGTQEYCIQYLPWASFNKDFISRAHDFVLPEKLTDYHHQLIKKYHPAPDKLSRGAYRLMARNCYQVLGKDLNQPVNAVICWCEEHYGPDGQTVWSGGTGFANRMAFDMDIPIINMYREQFDTANKVIGYLKNILEI